MARPLRSVACGLIGPALLASIISSGAGAQSPAFAAGDVGTLAASLTQVERCTNKKGLGASIVTIKVANRGALHGEPTVFELTPKTGPASIVRRTPGPDAGRFGRGVAPGASQSFAMMVMADPVDLANANVAVLAASFAAGGLAAPDPVRVGPVRAEKRMHELGATVDYSVVPLTHAGDGTVDVLLRVEFERPANHVLLRSERLGPKEAREISFASFVPEVVQADAAGEFVSVDFVVPSGARVGSVKVVDWCFVSAEDAGAGAALFSAAYGPWIRWDDASLSVAGAFEARFETAGMKSRRAAGTFIVSSTGASRATPDEPIAAKDSEALHGALRRAFADLRRPGLDEALKAAAPRVGRFGSPVVLQLDGRRWDETKAGIRHLLTVDASRFSSVKHSYAADAPGSDWTTEPFEGGYVIAEKRERSIGGRATPTEIERFRYARAGAHVFPVSYYVERDLAPVALRTSTALAFRDVRADAQAAAPVDSPAMKVVRDAWNNGFRHPSSKADLSGRVTVKPGKDGLWRGAKSVVATFTLHGYAGGRFERGEAAVEGRSDAEVRGTLEWTILDRIRMWQGRDFAARPSFEDAFPAASFAERAGSPGVYDVTGGSCRAVRIADGRIASLIYEGGVERAYAWTNVGDFVVATKATTGPEVVEARFKIVEGRPVASWMKFAGVFGDQNEWGTEELTFADLKLR